MGSDFWLAEDTHLMQNLVAVRNVVRVVKGDSVTAGQHKPRVLGLRRADVAGKPDIGERRIVEILGQHSLRVVAAAIVHHGDVAVPPRLFQRSAHGGRDQMRAIMGGDDDIDGKVSHAATPAVVSVVR